MVHQVGLIPQVNLVMFHHYWNLESSTEDENLIDPHTQIDYNSMRLGLVCIA